MSSGWRSWGNGKSERPAKTVGVSRLVRRLLRWRWAGIAILAVTIVLFELYEHPSSFTRTDPLFISESLVFLALLLVIGNAFEIVLRAVEDKSSVMRTLKLKHQLSLKLAIANDLNELSATLIQFLRGVLPLSGASIFMYSPGNPAFLPIARYTSDGGELLERAATRLSESCKACALKTTFALHRLSEDCLPPAKTDARLASAYCLPLTYGSLPRALLHVALPAGQILNEGQAEILNSIGPELSVALEAAHQRRLIAEQSIARATDSERRGIARDLHDTLGQDLCTLRLKIDQVTEGGSLEQNDQLRVELEQMRDIADEAYELVRGTLASLHPENATQLAELLHGHSLLVGERSNLEVRFSSQGDPRPLDPALMRQIFYIYREALNNAVRHARASRVEVNLTWTPESLAIRVEDDGCGFDPQATRLGSHFGLVSMRERTSAFNGEFSLVSAPGRGTRITFRFPLSTAQAVTE